MRYEPGSRRTARRCRPQPDLALRAQLIAKLHTDPASVQVTRAGGALGANAKLITVLLPGGGAVQIATPVGLEIRVGLLEELATVAFLVFATAGLWFWVTWTVNHPLDRFARAAERVGVDVHSPPLAVHGPLQLQRAIRAFNEMQVRLQRLLTDRTLMLGAISHDLGTPLTRLRLRVETDRADDKAKMLADIEAMQIMLTSALSFVRGVDDAEPREVVDLDSLLQTVCDLVSDLGGDVTYGAPRRSNYYCKPQAMLRALTNVVTNAAKYGEHAAVTPAAHRRYRRSSSRSRMTVPAFPTAKRPRSSSLSIARTRRANPIARAWDWACPSPAPSSSRTAARSSCLTVSLTA